MSKVKPLSPDRMQTEAEWLRSRRNQLARMIENFWPEGFDNVPRANSHYPAEFDKAIELIKKRRERFRKQQPKKKHARPPTWDEMKYKMLLVRHDELRGTQHLKGQALFERLGLDFGIRNPKKIQERLKKAIESVNQKKVIYGG